MLIDTNSLFSTSNLLLFKYWYIHSVPLSKERTVHLKKQQLNAKGKFEDRNGEKSITNLIIKVALVGAAKTLCSFSSSYLLRVGLLCLLRLAHLTLRLVLTFLTWLLWSSRRCMLNKQRLEWWLLRLLLILMLRLIEWRLIIMSPRLSTSITIIVKSISSATASSTLIRKHVVLIIIDLFAKEDRVLVLIVILLWLEDQTSFVVGSRFIAKYTLWCTEERLILITSTLTKEWRVFRSLKYRLLPLIVHTLIEGWYLIRLLCKHEILVWKRNWKQFEKLVKIKLLPVRDAVNDNKHDFNSIHNTAARQCFDESSTERAAPFRYVFCYRHYFWYSALKHILEATFWKLSGFFAPSAPNSQRNPFALRLHSRKIMLPNLVCLWRIYMMIKSPKKTI